MFVDFKNPKVEPFIFNPYRVDAFHDTLPRVSPIHIQPLRGYLYIQYIPVAKYSENSNILEIMIMIHYHGFHPRLFIFNPYGATCIPSTFQRLNILKNIHSENSKILEILIQTKKQTKSTTNL